MTEIIEINHWLIRVGDGKHLDTSSKFGIWGVDSNDANVKSFMGLGKSKNKKDPVKKGDVLWFIKGGCGGLAIAFANFDTFVKRIPGETISNYELGWDQSLGSSNGKWDYEVKFTNFLDITHKKVLTCIKSPGVVRRYNPETCKGFLPLVYNHKHINLPMPSYPELNIKKPNKKPILIIEDCEDEI